MAASIPITNAPSVTANSPGMPMPGTSNANVLPTLPLSNSPTSPASFNNGTGNPYVTSSGTSSIPSISSGISTQDGDYTVMGDFKQTYGAGTGSAIVNTLSTLGTSLDPAIQATTDVAYQNANKASAGINSQLAAAGISKDSSTSALAQGDFWSGVQTNLNNTVANMELSQQSTLLQTLLGEGSAHGGDSSWTDSIGDIFSGLTSAAGAISEGFGVGGTAGSILDTIGALAI